MWQFKTYYQKQQKRIFSLISIEFFNLLQTSYAVILLYQQRRLELVLLVLLQVLQLSLRKGKKPQRRNRQKRKRTKAGQEIENISQNKNMNKHTLEEKEEQERRLRAQDIRPKRELAEFIIQKKVNPIKSWQTEEHAL